MSRRPPFRWDRYPADPGGRKPVNKGRWPCFVAGPFSVGGFNYATGTHAGFTVPHWFPAALAMMPPTRCGPSGATETGGAAHRATAPAAATTSAHPQPLPGMRGDGLRHLHRMKRRVIHLATVLSLATFVAVVTLWVRSVFIGDRLLWAWASGATEFRGWDVQSRGGGLMFSYLSFAPPDPGDQAKAHAAVKREPLYWETTASPHYPRFGPGDTGFLGFQAILDGAAASTAGMRPSRA